MFNHKSSASLIATKDSNCPYCGGVVKYSEDSEFIYGRDFGPVYYCEHYSGCNAFVGCYKGTDKALGRLADSDLRRAKKEAHYEFDCIWEAKKMLGYEKARSMGYVWLSEQLNIPLEETHIGMFDVTLCEKVVEICYPYAEKIRRSQRWVEDVFFEEVKM